MELTPLTNEACGHPTFNKETVLFGAASITHPLRNICARLNAFHPPCDRIGIEYMITPRLFASLPPDERSLWHSHVYEVKSGMLVMPNSLVPQTLWDTAENKETGEIITFYGKTYRLWRTDREDSLPPGGPRLMTRFTRDGQLDLAKGGEIPTLKYTKASLRPWNLRSWYNIVAN
ncbi:DUF1264 domain protein [Metarhizium robertsii]|uniref:DUF1264 domain protein n=1 Tax=Metarhizium robertsii TaxID=568076 RepID=A0A014NEQ3_9HYPO|nr:DUF1264 domain protein [Metarhizium robertsii]